MPYHPEINDLVPIVIMLNFLVAWAAYWMQVTHAVAIQIGHAIPHVMNLDSGVPAYVAFVPVGGECSPTNPGPQAAAEILAVVGKPKPCQMLVTILVAASWP